jgi:hypothetical protein
VQVTAEKFTSRFSSAIDDRVLGSTPAALGVDGSWEMFFVAIPGFFDSEQVNEPEEHPVYEFRIKSSRALNGFLDSQRQFLTQFGLTQFGYPNP